MTDEQHTRDAEVRQLTLDVRTLMGDVREYVTVTRRHMSEYTL